jgi:UDP-GlcNAc:undecaprenyl-phosphate/decaprenyl-phosphate GlcNAc-1-phosphate transferase
VSAVGLWDDAAAISPRMKLALQVLAAAIMIAGAGMVLRSVGDLAGWRPIGLSVLAAPMTVFALVGVVNALNMIDGLDGLCGSIAFIAFAWYAAAAAQGGLHGQMLVAVIFCGAIAGFLLFNLRLPWQREARAFLGDAGSLMLGFALGWLAIDLTQRAGGALYPISALWILLLPLADCVSLLTRRLQRGAHPFVADREHIHHYLLERGFTPQQTMAILVAISACFGAVGYFGWRLSVPEPWLFWPFCFGYFAYHAWIKAAWKRLRSEQGAHERGPRSLEERTARALG